MMRTCFAVVLVGLFGASPATAGGVLGQCPFTSFAGTGFYQADNALYYNGSGWYDLRTGGNSTLFQHKSTLGSDTCLWYEEQWNQPRPLGTVMLSASGTVDGSSGGEVYVQRTPGGAFEKAGSFDLATGAVQFLDLAESRVWGVRVEVTRPASSSGYYQIGSIGFYEERFTNVAYGRASISSPHAGKSGSVTDQNIWSNPYSGPDNTYFMSTPAALYDPYEEWVGVDFGQGEQLRGLLINTSAFGNGYPWLYFDVEVYRKVNPGDEKGQWVTLFRGMDTYGSSFWNDDFIWVDFGPDGEFAEQVRLYGNQDRRNDPQWVWADTSHGQIITEIMAFVVRPDDPVAPEPMTLTLLALGGAVLLRRRGEKSRVVSD